MEGGWKGKKLWREEQSRNDKKKKSKVLMSEFSRIIFSLHLQKALSK